MVTTAWGRSNLPASTDCNNITSIFRPSCVYGWAGGVTYIVLLAGSTLWNRHPHCDRAYAVAAYLITAFATFVGEVLEGFIIDTDHWRHFFLLLGMVWGLAAATLNQTRHNRAPLPPGARYAGTPRVESW